jgi:hypothetical protein
MNNGEVLQLINYLVNKSESGETLTPVQYPIVVNAAQTLLFKKKTGVPEEYTVQVQQSQQEPNKSDKLTNDLLPFNVIMSTDNNNPLLIDGNGIAQLPSDFYYKLSLAYTQIYNKGDSSEKRRRRIEVVTDDIWEAKLSSTIDSPSKKGSMANFKSNYIRFYPLVNEKTDFSYIRLPKKCFYDFYISSYGQEIYLPQGISYTLKIGEQGSAGQIAGTTVVSKSIELEWNEVCVYDIVYYTLSLIGVNLQNEVVMQFAEKIKEKGT